MLKTVKVKKLNDKAVIPKYQTEGAAGFDLHATESKVIDPEQHNLVGTGLAMKIPDGYVGLLFPRSGNAVKHSINLINCVGVIDSDYIGEVKAPLHNEGKKPFKVEEGDRIAQMVIVPFEQVSFVEVDELEETDRGEGGFGSTGIKA